MDRTLHLHYAAFTDTMEKIFNSLRWERIIELHNTAQVALATYRDVELTVGMQIELAHKGWNFDSINFDPKTLREREIAAHRIRKMAQKVLNARMVRVESDMLLATTYTQRGESRLWEAGLPTEPVVTEYTANFLYLNDRKKYLTDLMKYIRETKPRLETLRITNENLTGTAHDIVRFIIDNWTNWENISSDIHDVKLGEKRSKLLKRMGINKTYCRNWSDIARIIAYH